MRVVLLALLIGTAGNVGAQSLNGNMQEYLALTPRQQDLVAVSINSIPMHIYRQDGSVFTDELPEERDCGKIVLGYVAGAKLKTSREIAAENVRCINLKFQAEQLPYQAKLDE